MTSLVVMLFILSNQLQVHFSGEASVIPLNKCGSYLIFLQTLLKLIVFMQKYY